MSGKDHSELDEDIFLEPDEILVSSGFVSRDKAIAAIYAKKLENEFLIRSEIRLDPRHSNSTTWEQWIVMAKAKDVAAYLEPHEYQHFDSSPKAFFDQEIDGAIFKGSFDLIEGLLHLKNSSASDDTKQFVLYPYDWDTNRWQVMEMNRSISYNELWLATSDYEEAEEITWPWDAGDDDWARPPDADDEFE